MKSVGDDKSDDDQSHMSDESRDSKQAPVCAKPMRLKVVLNLKDFGGSNNIGCMPKSAYKTKQVLPSFMRFESLVKA